MLRRESVDDLTRFKDEAAEIIDAGFIATKMKVGLGPHDDVKLATAVAEGG